MIKDPGRQAESCLEGRQMNLNELVEAAQIIQNIAAGLTDVLLWAAFLFNKQTPLSPH
jgi:hypothetical protein